MFCEQCGASLPEGANFCEECGAPVPQQAAPVAPVVQPEPKSELKPELKPEPKPALKQEPKPEPKPDSQPIPRSGTVTPRRFSSPRLVIGALILAILVYAAYWVLFMM